MKILTDHRDVMDRMARLLIERETIYTEEVDLLIEGKSVEEVKAELDARLNEKYKNKKTPAADSRAETKPTPPPAPSAPTSEQK